MLVAIHPENPQQRKIEQVINCLRTDGVIIYPTDTLYGLGCSLESPAAIEKLCRLRDLDPKKAHLTVIVSDIQAVSNLVKPMDKQQFKLLKKHVPGPFTFIFKSAKSLPKSLRNRKDTLGIRVIANPIAKALLDALEHPILSISFKDEDQHLDYPNDPEEIYEVYGKKVDMLVAGGLGGNEPSTIVDFTQEEPEVLRQGLGQFLVS